MLLGLLLPWTWLLPWTLAAGGRWRDPDYRFLVIWAAVIVVFFSLSRGKLVPYILPALLPLALLVGHGLARLTGVGRLSFNSRLLKTSLLVWAVTGVVLVALSLWPPGAPGPGPGPGQPLISLSPDGLSGLGPDPPGRPDLAAPGGAVAGGAAAGGPGAPGHRPGEPGAVV